MIKAIIFDLGKTIVPFDVQRAYEALQPHCRYTLEEIPERVRASDLVHRFESGQIAPEDFVPEFSELLGMKVSYPQFCKMWSSIFLPETLVPESMVESLHQKYRVLLLSN